MLISSLRLGTVEVPENKIIEMARPILGFEKLVTFGLIEREEFWPFLWMQSVDDPAVAFVIVNPSVFTADYTIEVNPKEIAEIEPTAPELIEIFVIANITDNPDSITANLQGPILINSSNNKAKQLVLVNSEYKLQQPVFELELVTAAAAGILRKEPVGA